MEESPENPTQEVSPENPSQDESPKDSMVVSVKDDGMTALLKIPANQDPLEITEEASLGHLKEADLMINETVVNNVKSAMKKYLQNPSEELEVVVATGTRADHGQDGHFDLVEELKEILESSQGNTEGVDDDDSKPEPESAPQEALTEESIDFYSQSKYAIVVQGTTIGLIVPHTEGTDGTTVTGTTIVAKSGKPFQILEHESIEIQEDGTVISKESGVLQIEGKKVFVSDVLDVHGYVDFTTGNIHFPGDVTVNKGVRDCFIIDAEKSITVRGLVEAASLRTGEDLHLAGGMAAREKGTIHVGRDLHARYLGMVVGTVIRNAMVEKEVVDSEMDVRGNVVSDRCSWIGGRLAVTGSCSIGELGGESGVRTELIAGRVLKADGQFATSDHIKEELTRRCRRFEKEQSALHKNTTKLNAGQAERMTELQFEISSLQDMKYRLEKVEKTLHESIDHAAIVEIIVQRRINPGTVIKLGEYDVNFNDELKGPVRIILSTTNRPMATNPHSGTPIELRDFATVRQREGNIEGAADESLAA